MKLYLIIAMNENKMVAALPVTCKTADEAKEEFTEKAKKIKYDAVYALNLNNNLEAIENAIMQLRGKEMAVEEKVEIVPEDDKIIKLS